MSIFIEQLIVSYDCIIKSKRQRSNMRLYKGMLQETRLPAIADCVRFSSHAQFHFRLVLLHNQLLINFIKTHIAL